MLLEGDAHPPYYPTILMGLDAFRNVIDPEVFDKEYKVSKK